MDISSAATVRQRLPVMHQISICGRRVWDQRSVITVTSRRLSAHVALPSAVLVGHVRHLNLTAPAATAALDLFVNWFVLVRQIPRKMYVLTVMGVQLMMSWPVTTTVHDLRVFMFVRYRSPSATTAASGSPIAAHLVVLVHSSRSAVSSGVSQGQGIVCPRRVFLLGATMAGVTGIRFKRNVLRDRQIRLSNRRLMMVRGI